MKTTAIICEYNPLTYGHISHLEKARQDTGADTVICVMSGSFTQRGEGAIIDKYERAYLATKYGADMVIELPLIYAISPADNFAYGALKCISALPNVEYLSFGSECGDIELLKKAAEFSENEPIEFKSILNNYLSEGYNYPKAYSLSLKKYSETNLDFYDISSVFDSPNNCLGVSYIKAAKSINMNIKFHTIKRENNDNDNELSGDFPSASSIRNAFRMEKFDEIKKFVPIECYELLENSKNNPETLNDLCLFKMKSVSGYDLEKLYDMDVSGGLYNRLKLASSDSVTFDEFLNKSKTKKYTMAKIKRLCLYNLFDITQRLYDEALNIPPYIFVLTLKNERKDILSELNTSCPNLLIRYSDINKVDKSVRPYVKLDFRAQGTLALINRTQSIRKSILFV